MVTTYQYVITIDISFHGPYIRLREVRVLFLTLGSAIRTFDT